MKNLFAAVVLAVAAVSAAHARTDVHEPWVRATVPAQTNTGAFMRITAQRASRLIEATSAVAARVEIHESVLEDGVAKMRHVPVLDLPAGQAVELKPGSYHVMLIDLKEQIREGDRVPITLTIESASGARESVLVQAVARALGHSGRPH